MLVLAPRRRVAAICSRRPDTPSRSFRRNPRRFAPNEPPSATSSVSPVKKPKPSPSARIPPPHPHSGEPHLNPRRRHDRRRSQRRNPRQTRRRCRRGPHAPPAFRRNPSRHHRRRASRSSPQQPHHRSRRRSHLGHHAHPTEEDLARYIATREPRGKAGAYAIQGQAARWIPASTAAISMLWDCRWRWSPA